MRYESTTGLSSGQVVELVASVAQVVDGGGSGLGRPRALGLYRQVVLVLMLVRQNMSQSVAADVFGVSQSTVSRVFRAVLPLVEQVTRVNSPGGIDEVFLGRVVVVDGTDVPTGNRASGKHNYSGKRHRQGVVVQVACGLDGVLLAVSDPVPGCRHDRRAVTETGWEDALNRVGASWIADPAYVGTTALTPMKKPIRGELSEDRKHVNRVISGYRSAVERCIAHLKNWKMLATGYRGRLNELPNIIRIITRLEFYRLRY
jgi:hypothetical protein